MQDSFEVSHEISSALSRSEPVVALESCLIAHGLPGEVSVRTALEMEERVREAGAVPATIGLIEGKIRLGLTREEIERLAAGGAAKIAVRDMPYSIARKLDGGTTVSATMRIASAAGIQVVATGGIGGVHRGYAESLDISADLWEIARTPAVVVCSGVKAIADIPASLEWLETHGVPVYGYETDVFPAFYSHTIVKQMAMYHEASIKGIFMEHSSEFTQSHLLDLPDIYVTVRMARDAKLDGNALINEFFKLYYGNAAKPMKELCNRIEDTYSDQRNYPADIRTAPKDWHQTEAVAWGSLGTPERMAEFARLMDKARAAAKTDTEKRRVAMFDEGVWQYMVDGLECHKSIDARKKMPLPRLTIERAPDAGGDPSKVDWSQAVVLDDWCRAMGDPTSRKITGRVIHDGKYLYVELQEDTDTSKLVSSSDISRGDDWEVFFAAKREKPYRQILVSPEGKHTELAHGEDSAIWDCGATVTSDKSSPKRWVTRLSIPLGNLIPGGVKPGGTFYANFYRGIGWQTEFLAWSPNFVGDFHELGRLGEFILE